MPTYRYFGLMTCILLIAGCATVNSHWEEALKADTIASYRDFMRRYPENPLAEDARRQIEKLQWKEARRLDTVGAYQTFLATKPSYELADSARTRLAQLEWTQTKGVNTSEALKAFLQRYPGQSRPLWSRDPETLLRQNINGLLSLRESDSRYEAYTTDYFPTPLRARCVSLLTVNQLVSFFDVRRAPVSHYEGATIINLGGDFLTEPKRTEAFIAFQKALKARLARYVEVDSLCSLQLTVYCMGYGGRMETPTVQGIVQATLVLLDIEKKELICYDEDLFGYGETVHDAVRDLAKSVTERLIGGSR